jgi:hypothetical protein
MPPRLRSFVPFVTVLVAVACTGDTTPPPTAPPTSVTTGGSASVDPLVPYSPPPTPFAQRTTGFIPDTLTLPTTEGATLAVTPVTTTMTLRFVDETRAFVVYLEVRDTSGDDWSGVVGADAEVTDASGGVFPAEAPAKGDLHPDPGRYGGVNRNLLRPIDVASHRTVKGALVFHVTGGNRAITVRLSLDGGQTWGEWSTNLGTF